MGLFTCRLFAKVSKEDTQDKNGLSTGFELLHRGQNPPGKFLWFIEMARSNATKPEAATRHYPCKKERKKQP